MGPAWAIASAAKRSAGDAAGGRGLGAVTLEEAERGAAGRGRGEGLGVVGARDGHQAALRGARALESAGVLERHHAVFLAVEEELDLAKGIANALLASEPKLARRGIDAGWVWGAETEGGVAVVRHLHGGFVELLRVGWEGTDVEVDSVPLAHEEELPDRRRALGVPQKAERVPLERAIDRLTEQLWRVRRRGGDLPERLRAYADLFRVSRHA